MTTDCRQCEKPFTPRSTGGHKQVYCSPDCRTAYHTERARTLPPTAPPNVKGGRQAVCEHCGKTFTTRSRAGGRRQRTCSKKCMCAAWHTRNPDASWKAALQKYGMTPDDYLSLLAKQNGVCAICSKPPKNNRLAVDHDHDTGEVRGILCHPCNRHVGYFEKFGLSIRGYLLNPPASDGFSTEASINRAV